jgi:ankyrin repeat protein
MPIHVAVISGNTDCVRVLVEHGATVMDPFSIFKNYKIK